MKSDVINLPRAARVVEVNPARITRPEDIVAGQTLADDEGGIWFAIEYASGGDEWPGEAVDPAVYLIPDRAAGYPLYLPAAVAADKGMLWLIAEVRA